MNDLALSAPTALGIAANAAAAQFVFADYISRKSANTIRNQRADLASYALFLEEIGAGKVDCDSLQQEPAPWRGTTWGMASAFVQWLLKRGFSTATIQRRLSTIKKYSELALQAGAISPDQYTMIATVHAYAGAEAMRIDKRRVADGLATRIGNKKADPTDIDEEQAIAMKRQRQPDTPQGKRDRLLMCLLLDHGLRVGEVAILTIKNFDTKKSTVRFYRPKVDLWQTHKLSSDTKKALTAYLSSAAAASGQRSFADDDQRLLFYTSTKKKMLVSSGYTERSIQYRVAMIGLALGIETLSPHDCRHYWATKTAQLVEAGKIDLLRLQEAGGWNSLKMPRHYVKLAEIANKGIV